MKHLAISFLRVFKIFLAKVGSIQARIILTLLYILLIVPVGILMRGRNELSRTTREDQPSFWVTRQKKEGIEEYSRRQY